MSFDYQPVLKGDLVELRPLRSADYDELYAVAADPLIWEQLSLPRFDGHRDTEHERLRMEVCDENGEGEAPTV